MVRITCKDGKVKAITVSCVGRSVSILEWREWGIAIDMSNLGTGSTSAED
jgi:hypothetical protein